MVKPAPTLQTDAFGHTEAELLLAAARAWARATAADRGEYDEEAGEDDKTEYSYERPTCVNPQTGALERM